MRSDLNPDLAMATFRWAAPAFALVFAWAVAAGILRTARWARQTRKANGAARSSRADE